MAREEDTLQWENRKESTWHWRPTLQRTVAINLEKQFIIWNVLVQHILPFLVVNRLVNIWWLLIHCQKKKYNLAWIHFLDSLSPNWSFYLPLFPQKYYSFDQLLFQPPSHCLWKPSFVLLHSFLCVERKWFAFCMLFIESFSTEMASPPPDGSEHPHTAATRHLMSYFLIGSSCSQTLWLLQAYAQLYQLWVSCSET